MIKGIVFDLDGTLVDTIYDLYSAVNFALKKRGYTERTLEQVRSFVGNGISNLMERSAPEGCSEKEINCLLKDFSEYYLKHCCDNSVPYGGIAELLETLRERGIKVAVITNKAHNMAAIILEKLFGNVFDSVVGMSDMYPKKPNPTSTLKTLEKLGVKREESLFIGDSEVDILTAKNSNIKSVGVSWGFRSVEKLRKTGADYIITSPFELLSIIEENA